MPGSTVACSIIHCTYGYLVKLINRIRKLKNEVFFAKFGSVFVISSLFISDNAMSALLENELKVDAKIKE